ncbi:hypothetical protein [Williamsoniiplasma luminosum]|uniref:Uncharacterized protein n=1 Tax=Williamsoniiplasma luminosum TaxID=214888 RepID=A0A2S0NK25_9MOLU|nr:hypothetical protein [Williamsoniiplasma luminosum]AVP49352.1 MAG: hypothetical protein C5T88_02020 [Williamsoniiplasma luminosum]
MKKTILFLVPTLLVPTFATQVISCGPKYQILSQDISNWDVSTIFQSNANLYQAIAAGKDNVYLDPAKGSTPFLDENGKFLSISEVVAKNWPGGSDNNKGDRSSMWMNLQYVAPSMLSWYQKQSAKDLILTDYQSIIDNFEIGYSGRLDLNTAVATFGEPSAIQKMNDAKIEYVPTSYLEYLERADTNIRQEHTDTFLAPMKKLSQSGLASEAVQVPFSIHFFIKQDPKQTLISKEIDGKTYQFNVSKDGYYSTNLNEQKEPTNALLNIRVGFMFTASVF